jgi:hypothetical protein
MKYREKIKKILMKELDNDIIATERLLNGYAIELSEHFTKIRKTISELKPND